MRTTGKAISTILFLLFFCFECLSTFSYIKSDYSPALLFWVPYTLIFTLFFTVMVSRNGVSGKALGFFALACQYALFFAMFFFAKTIEPLDAKMYSLLLMSIIGCIATISYTNRENEQVTRWIKIVVVASIVILILIGLYFQMNQGIASPASAF